MHLLRCSTATGLVLHSCPNIKSLLSTAAGSQLLSSELQDAAAQYLEAPVIPYPVIRDIWVQLTPGYGVPFHQVLAGSSFVLESPKPREKVPFISGGFGNPEIRLWPEMINLLSRFISQSPRMKQNSAMLM